MSDFILINPDDREDPFYDGMGFVHPENVPRKKPHALTSTQQNFRARRIEDEHNSMKGKPMMPSHDQLQNMSAEQRENVAAGFRHLKQQLELGQTVAENNIAVQPTLPFAENE